ncbi:hypothetical protein N9164_00615 [Draconibacterium sp.]|nr:hypothetical protein [Draconibacterium sp.]
MKPSQNAFIGYSYQQCVTFLLLAKMDSERQFKKIEMEADVDNNFDDVEVTCDKSTYNLQIKDFKQVSLDNLKIFGDNISINGKSHILSKNINVLFFKNINITSNCEIFGFPAFKSSGVYIISLSRTEIADRVNDMYESNRNRESIIRHFYDECLDKRKLVIHRKDLPTIEVFKTQLIEPTIDIGKNHLTVENILIVEGKPGVGKSHFVNCIKEDYIKNLIYRFWVSNQDKDYNERLKYKNFIFDFSKKLFNDLINRDEEEIIQKIHEDQITVIIDGLDHIENYNNHELDNFVDFIGRLGGKSKTIVLTRPLTKQLEWKKFLLSNWNLKQTETVLNELYHISEYNVIRDIFSLTDGYPILVRFLAEHYKIHSEIPNLKKLTDIDNYYGQIIKQEKGKHALSIFLCTHSFFMKSEIEIFLEDELSTIVFEYLEEHSYLFEIRLNRISLFHDSFITYLRKQFINYSSRLEKVNEYVYQSIMDGDKRFLSRFSFFDLEIEKIKDIVKKYSSINAFKSLTKDTIDFESIPAFYFQVREAFTKLSFDDFDIINYYDLALIINLIERDHVSTINKFLYTYIKTLIFNGITEEDITSSRYLFAMFYYIKTKDGTLLYNNTSNDYFSTEYFYEELEGEVEQEELFFEKHKKLLTGKKIKELLHNKNDYDLHELITFILENIYIHKLNLTEYTDLSESINKYMNADEKEGISILKSFLTQYNIRDAFFASTYLKDAKRNILASGKESTMNDYKVLNLKDFIIKHQDLGSFDTWVEILNYLRLSLYEKRKIDIQNIAPFWTKYHQRKDYSVFNIAVALTIFEKKGFVEKIDSCNLINSIQDVSEKGYHGLLAEYIILHSVDIIQYLNETFNVEDLIISWLELPHEYIDVLPDNIFQSALKKILGYNRSNKQIDCKEVINVIDSNRKEELKYVLNLTRYKLRISNAHPKLEKLKKENLDLIEIEPDNNVSYNRSSITRYNQGILSIDEKDFILEKKLKPFEVAGFSNGNYAVFSDLDIYKLFEKEDIKNNIKQILYNAILGKVKSINSFCSLYYFLGNLPKIAFDYKIETDFRKLHYSFTSFLDLSMLKLNSKDLNETYKLMN